MKAWGEGGNRPETRASARLLREQRAEGFPGGKMRQIRASCGLGAGTGNVQ